MSDAILMHRKNLHKKGFSEGLLEEVRLNDQESKSQVTHLLETVEGSCEAPAKLPTKCKKMFPNEQTKHRRPKVTECRKENLRCFWTSLVTASARR